MEVFKSFISFMAYASLGFSLTAAYLKLNKLWKRKHIEEVTNSVSITGNVLDIIPLTVFSLNFLLVAQWQGFIDSVIWIVTGAILVVIGSGTWVERNRRKGFWTRIKAALTLERSEVGNLAMTFLRPSGAEIVLEIFARFAYIDRVLAKSERELIQSFADTWRLEIKWDDYDALALEDQAVSFVKTRDTVVRYLRTAPPIEQAAQLIDVLDELVKVDEDIADQEKLILDEVRGLLQGYISDTGFDGGFNVIIAPQNHDQEAAIVNILPGAERLEVAGGSGFLVGSFFSKQYANVVCEQYRALGFLTIDLQVEQSADQAAGE